MRVPKYDKNDKWLLTKSKPEYKMDKPKKVIYVNEHETIACFDSYEVGKEFMQQRIEIAKEHIIRNEFGGHAEDATDIITDFQESNFRSCGGALKEGDKCRYLWSLVPITYVSGFDTREDR